MSAIRSQENTDEQPYRQSRLGTKDLYASREREVTKYPTATEILELIKLKKEELTGSGGKPPSSEKSMRSAGRDPVVLPRINSASKEDINSLEVQVRSMSTSHAKQITEVDSEAESSHNRHEKNNSRRYLTLQCQEIDEAQELQQLRNTESFQQCLGQVPRLSKFRNVKNMQPLVNYLRQTNPFFKNVPDILVSSLLKVCRLRNYSRSEKVFHRSDKLDSLFIILWGKVRLSDLISDYRKVSVRGETLCEQVLFDPSCPKLRFENAKALTTTTLLQIPLYLYRKIYEQLVMYGYKSEFMAMENLIKRNFIFKQSIRAQANKQ